MKPLLIALTFLLISGCATLGQSDSQRILWQYATVKLIQDSDSVTSAGVIERVEMIRALSDAKVEITPEHMVNQVLRSLGDIKPAERLLIVELLNGLQGYVLEVEAPAERAQRLDVVLNWVEQAARISQ